MRLFDATKTSPQEVAFRVLTDREHWHDGEQPNMALVDKKHDPPRVKVFRAVEHIAWMRRSLKMAKTYDDWQPLETGCACCGRPWPVTG